MEIEEQIKEIMSRKDSLGEFSVDLYYDDLAQQGEQYVAKLRINFLGDEVSGLYAVAHHARCGSFGEALDDIGVYLHAFEYQLLRLNDRDLAARIVAKTWDGWVDVER